MARKRTSLDVLFTRKEPEKKASEVKKEVKAEASEQKETESLSADKESKEKEGKQPDASKKKAEIKETESEEVLAEVKTEPEPEEESEAASTVEAQEDTAPLPRDKKKKTKHKAAGKWEFRALQVFYDQVEDGEQVYWDYCIDFSDGTRLTGLNEILNTFAEKGWDLVNVFPSYTASLGAAGENFAMELRVILKRERS